MLMSCVKRTQEKALTHSVDCNTNAKPKRATDGICCQHLGSISMTTRAWFCFCPVQANSPVTESKLSGEFSVLRLLGKLHQATAVFARLSQQYTNAQGYLSWCEGVRTSGWLLATPESSGQQGD